MDEKIRQRALRRLLRITLPDGKVLYYKSATMTFVEALQKIEADKLKEVKLESYHLPLISQEVYPRFKDWMKPLSNGWYVNVQSDSDQKYMQLVSIAQQLGLDWKIEVGSDFTPSNDKVPQRKKRETQRLMVKFPDGTTICNANPVDTFRRTSAQHCILVLKLPNGPIRVKKGHWSLDSSYKIVNFASELKYEE